MNTAKRIKDRRKELNMSVEELANRIGKSRATVYRYENGEIEDLPVTVLKPLARALHTTPEYLMGWTDSKEVLPIADSNGIPKIANLGHAMISLLESVGWEINQRSAMLVDFNEDSVIEYIKDDSLDSDFPKGLVMQLSRNNITIDITYDEYNNLLSKLKDYIDSEMRDLIQFKSKL